MTQNQRAFRHRHLLGIEQLDADEIIQIIDLADSFRSISERPIKKVPTLRGRTVLNVFFEPSTRTRVSFELAAKRMSADAVNISGSSSSRTKGETVLDTARNLQAMNPDVIVLRHSASGTPGLVAAHVDAAVINAGDGSHEHPTQALLDCATIRRHKGDGRSIAGLRVVIVGDIEHSRVARSNILALAKLGATVHVCGPATMIPRHIERIGGDLTRERVRVFYDLAAALDGADVVMMLRIQNERIGGVSLFANPREYARYYGLSARTVARAKADAIIMHPGPINRGVEMTPDIADGERSVILDQVTYGVAVRMAVLYLLGGGQSPAPAGEQ
jgi:aspartate carbamoyltransferase catalytic subunit